MQRDGGGLVRQQALGLYAASRAYKGLREPPPAHVEETGLIQEGRNGE